MVDEHAQLELVSLRPCFGDYSDESDSATVYDNCASALPLRVGHREEYEEAPAMPCFRPSEDSTPDEPDVHFSKKFLNVFMSGRRASPVSGQQGTWWGGPGGMCPQRQPQVHLVTVLGAEPGLGPSSPQLVLAAYRCGVLRALLPRPSTGKSRSRPTGHIQVRAEGPRWAGRSWPHPPGLHHHHSYLKAAPALSPRRTGVHPQEPGAWTQSGRSQSVCLLAQEGAEQTP